MFVIRSVLSNAKHPEYGSIPVDFPIPDEQYDHTIAQLEKLKIGRVYNSDCKIDVLNSWYTVLEPLSGQTVNADELYYLAKRLESFDDYEASQFQAMASKLGLSDIRDFINLTFSSQQVTVVTNFNELEQIGSNHVVTTHGGCISVEEYQRIDCTAEALKLLQSGNGSVTPYGVVYDNGMKLEQLYNGRHFPPYLYQPCQLVIEIQSVDGETGPYDYLYFPTPEQQLIRTLARAGETDAEDVPMRIVTDLLPKEVSERIDWRQESLIEVNEMCGAVAKLSQQERFKLNAAVLMAGPQYASEIRQLAENLEMFEFAPSVKTPKEYGKYMIQQSGRFEYDPNLEEFYDFQGYGRRKISAENGQFNDYGYISYHGVLTLDELIQQDPAEQSQDETGLRFGGIS